MGSILCGIFRWIFDWLYFVCLICFAGAVLGALSHFLWGVFFYEAPDHGYMLALGFKHGLNYGGVWAGGAAIVLCVMRARKEYLLKEASLEQEVDES
ncbi:MAG: hypothetical protein ACPGES_03410 [Coraliomargarita sp.]